MKNIFNREPVAYVAAIQSILIVAVSFHWLTAIGLDSSNDVMLVAGVMNGIAALVLAYKTTRTYLAPVVELFKAAAALGAIYGLNVTEEQSGLIIVAITGVAALFHQSQVTPGQSDFTP